MSWSAEEVEKVVERLMQALNDSKISQSSHYQRRKVYLKVCEFAVQQNLLPHEATAETVRALVALVMDMPIVWRGWAESEAEDNATFWIYVSNRRHRLPRKIG